MYCPVNNGVVCTNAVGVGLLGAWRLISSEYMNSTENLTSDVLSEAFFQPEMHGYLLIELHNGMVPYFDVVML